MSQIWNAEEVLKIDDPSAAASFSCNGHVPSQGRRCRLAINRGDAGKAYPILEELSNQEPDAHALADRLRSLADCCLCLNFHRHSPSQKDRLIEQWQDLIRAEGRRMERRRTPRSTLATPVRSLGDSGTVVPWSTPTRRFGIPVGSTGPRNWEPIVERVKHAALNLAVDARIGGILPGSSEAREVVEALQSVILLLSPPNRGTTQTTSTTTALPQSPEETPTTAETVLLTASARSASIASGTPQRALSQGRTRAFPADSTRHDNIRVPLENTIAPLVQSGAQDFSTAGARGVTTPRRIRPCSPAHVARRSLDEDCAACTESLADSRLEDVVWCKTQCGHNVHRSCFEEWEGSQPVGRNATCMHW